jgi:two-component system, LytTR family, response regulator
MSDRQITVLVADDEPLARRRLLRLLRAAPDIEVVAECKGGRSAVEQILARSPDLVFLDIQMPDLDGFGVIAEVGADRMPAVVFVTAYDQYALRAFEVHAFDYLLKPFEGERFDGALARVRAHLNARRREEYPGEEQLRRLLAEVLGRDGESGAKPASPYFERVAVKSDGGTRILQIADVDWFETDGNYVRVHVGKSTYLIRSTANRLQEELDPARFARIHRRFLVNVDRVVGLEPWFGGDAVVLLRDGTKLRLSRNFREEFLGRMLGDQGEGGE